MAEEKGVTPAQIAIAWLLHQPIVTGVIIGAKRVDRLRDNIAAKEVRLSNEEIARLNEVTELPVEYPGFILERQARPQECRTRVVRRRHRTRIIPTALTIDCFGVVPVRDGSDAVLLLCEEVPGVTAAVTMSSQVSMTEMARRLARR